MSNTNTDFSSRCSILGDLWVNYKSEPEFEDFIDYNDIGLPLAFAIAQDIIPASEMATKYINETWDLFLESLGVKDTGYSGLDELLSGFDNL
jgi:hypothetical protein